STAFTTVPARNSPFPRVKCLTRWRTSTSGMTGDLVRVVEIAARVPVGTDDEGRRRRVRARLKAIGAAWIEGAADGQRAQRGNRSFDRPQALTAGASGNRRQQSACVGMFGIAEH